MWLAPTRLLPNRGRTKPTNPFKRVVAPSKSLFDAKPGQLVRRLPGEDPKQSWFVGKQPIDWARRYEDKPVIGPEVGVKLICLQTAVELDIRNENQSIKVDISNPDFYFED